MNKGISIIWLIILGFILIAGSAYWYWVNDVKPHLDKSNESPSNSLGPTSDAAGWKTYRNEKYGFEVKYPENWAINLLDRSGYPIDESSAVYFQAEENSVVADGKPSGCISCSYFAVEPTLCEENYPIFKGEAAKNVLLNRIPAKQFISPHKAGEPTFFSIILFYANKSLWNAECSSIRMYVNPTYDQNKQVEHTKILNDILTSFKFIK